MCKKISSSSLTHVILEPRKKKIGCTMIRSIRFIQTICTINSFYPENSTKIIIIFNEKPTMFIC